MLKELSKDNNIDCPVLDIPELYVPSPFKFIFPLLIGPFGVLLI